MKTSILYSLNCDCPSTLENFFQSCEHERLAGTLSDESSTSSYGQPVVIGADGTTYGPAEARIIEIERGEPAARRFYTVAGEGTRFDTLPESAELQVRALAIGFSVPEPHLTGDLDPDQHVSGPAPSPTEYYSGYRGAI